MPEKEKRRQVVIRRYYITMTLPGQQFIKSQQDRAVSKTAIHPSWEASKRRKALENCEQTFQGKHTVFDD